MDLVIQGRRLSAERARALAARAAAADLRQVGTHAWRLGDAQRFEGLEALCASERLDFAWVPAQRPLASLGLFAMDMDSTLIDIECIDEIAAQNGLREAVSRITEAAMRGEMDFSESLRRRVGLLAGLEERALLRVYEERLRLNPGAEELLGALQAAGVATLLVSGGFTFFTGRLGERLGFTQTLANELEILQGRLTGALHGAIVDGPAKATAVASLAARLGVARADVVAVGDGANDRHMLQAAGLGIAYHAKPALREVAHCCIDYGGLDAILNLFE